MRATLIACLLFCAACRTGSLGACESDQQCPSGAICDPSAKVCVVPDGACFPACPSNQSCVSGQCVSAGGCVPACDAQHTCDANTLTCVPIGCNPPCDSAHTCDTSTNTCVAAGTGDATITSPAAGAIVSGTLNAAASAHAPGGVTSVTFELRGSGGALLASAVGAASVADPSSFTAGVPLTGLADGAASLDAVATWSTLSVTSAAVAVIIDQHPPTITLQTDGRTAGLFAAGQTATITATFADGTGSGVVASSVQLTIGTHAPIVGTAGSNGAFSFAVVIDDSIAPAGATTVVPYSIAATDGAGHTTTVAGDPREVIQVDRDAPQITSITVVTLPDFASGPGYYGGNGAPLIVTAGITDGAGIDASTVCLTIAGGACAKGVQIGTTSTYTFSLARPATGFDGTPLAFTISASDTLAAILTGASQAEHQATSAVQQVFFDDTPPSITIAADTAFYARKLPDGGPNPITVTAQIGDGTGVLSPRLDDTIAPRSSAGGTYSFQLDPAGLAAGTEGALAFHISAQDPLGNVASVNGSRNVDGAPPVAALKVFAGSEPADGGVTYPAAVANTGHLGTTFIYSDTVHVKGSLTDEGGIGGADLHIDGIALDGGVSVGVPRSLGCAAGATTCAFDVQVALNDAQNGTFHTGLADTTVGTTLIPFGTLQVVVDARDQAVQGDGGPAANSNTTQLGAATTRLLWFLSLTSTNNAGVSGLALHPDGDLIATTDAGASTVYDVAPDSPTLRWSFNAGAVQGTPSIGTGGAATAPIYVAAQTGDIYALAPDGGTAGHAITGTTVIVGLALATATFPGGVGAADEVLVPDDQGNTTSKLWSVDFDGGFFDKISSAGTRQTANDAPMVFDGGVWVGTQHGVDWHAVPGDGTLGPAVSLVNTIAGAGCCDFFGPITDGIGAFLTQRNTGGATIFGFAGDATFVGSKALTNAPTAQPSIGIDGQIYLSDSNAEAVAIDPATDNLTVVASAFGGNGKVPLQGSEGHIYVPRATGYMLALESGQPSWVFDPTGTIYRGALIDCQGRLFVASGATIFAFVSDDQGLADTGWPSLRRDSRNTGNAAALKYGIRTASGCTP